MATRPVWQHRLVQNGFVHLPSEAPWLAEYLNELLAFPNARRDNQFDSTAQALDWFRQDGQERGFLRLIRWDIQQMKREGQIPPEPERDMRRALDRVQCGIQCARNSVRHPHNALRQRDVHFVIQLLLDGRQ